jgi:hypothetical protein
LGICGKVGPLVFGGRSYRDGAIGMGHDVQAINEQLRAAFIARQAQQNRLPLDPAPYRLVQVLA